MKKIIILIFYLNLFQLAQAQSFENLSSLVFGGEVKYNPAHSEVIKKITNQDNFEVYVILKTKIDPKLNTFYTIKYDEGPSADPNFSIYELNENGQEKYIFSCGGEELIIPANGFFYTSSRSNEFYTKKRKFKLENSQIKEVSQAAYYIGLKTQTTSTITLYADKQKKEKAAILPKDYDVELIIEEGDWFLIKTAFGLTGWIHKENIVTYPPHEATFKDFYFAGD
jgi:hypothetical protein